MHERFRAEQAERVLAEPALVNNRDFQQINADVEAELDRLMAAHRAIEVQRDGLVVAVPVQHIHGAAAPRADGHGRRNAVAGLPGYGGYVPYVAPAPDLRVPGLYNAIAGPDALPEVAIPMGVNLPFDPFFDDPWQRPRGGEVYQPPPPPPPPLFDPEKAAAQEIKAAQDRAMRDAYLNAPGAVQARRRDQMRRMMKDPNLDDAAVERAILRGGTPEKKKDGEATPERHAREQGHAILDRLQNRREAAQSPQPRRANCTPPPQRAVTHLQAVGPQMGVPIEPGQVPAALYNLGCEAERILQPERRPEDERREHQNAARLYANRRDRIINRLGLLGAGVPPIEPAPVQEAPAAAPRHGDQPRGMFAHMRQDLQQVGRNAFREFVPPHLRPEQAPIQEAAVAQVDDNAEAPFGPFMGAIRRAEEVLREGTAIPEGQLPLPQEPVVAVAVVAGPDELRQALMPGPVIMAPPVRALDLPVIDDEVAFRRLRIRRELDERYGGGRAAAGEGFARRRQIRDLERRLRDLEMQFMQVIRRNQARFRPAAQPAVEAGGMPYAGDWDVDGIFQNMLLGDDGPRRIAHLGPRQAAIVERVNRRLGRQAEIPRMAPAVPREGPLGRQYLENLARRNRDRELNVAERARAEVRNEAVVGLGVGHVRHRAAEVDAAQPRPSEEAIPARIEGLRQMVAVLRGNVEEPDAANAARPIAAPHTAEMLDLNVNPDARVDFWAGRCPPAQAAAEARPGDFAVGNEGRLGELPQRPGRVERRTKRMAAVAAADAFGALPNEADRAREAAVGLSDDPFLAPAGHIVGLPPPNRGWNPFPAPFQPLLAPRVDANAQQLDVARLSSGLLSGVALNPKRPKKGVINAAPAGDGEKEQARPGADTPGGQGNNAGCGGFIGSAMRRVMSLRPRRRAQEGQPPASNEGNATRRSVSLRGIRRPRARDTPADEEPEGDDVFQSRAGSGDGLSDGPQVFRHDALPKQHRLSNGVAAAIGARPPQMQIEDLGDGSNDGHRGSSQHLPAQIPPFRRPVWRPYSERAGANYAQPALPVPVQAPNGAAALMQWLADDSGGSSDDSMAAQSGGSSVRQLRQARVEDEDEVEHPDPDLAISSSPLERLNLGMRRASIEDGKDADGAAPQQSPSDDVEMGEDNENDLEEGEVEEEL